MTEASPELDPALAVSVGRIGAPHGVRGEVRVEPLTDFPERFERGACLWLRDAPVRIEASRWRGRLVYLKLEGVEDRDAAEALRGEDLRVPQARNLEDEDRFYQHQIIGLRVESEAGDLLGQVESIFSTGANDVYVVRGERGELLLPAVEDVVKRVDLAAGRLVIDLLPGLEFTPASSVRKAPSRRRGRTIERRSSGDATSS